MDFFLEGKAIRPNKHLGRSPSRRCLPQSIYNQRHQGALGEAYFL